MSGNLLYSPAEIIQKLLIQQGLGSVPGANQAWPCYYSHLPDVPDNAFCVLDTEGRQEGRTNPDGETQFQHGFQVMVSAGDQPTGYLKAKAIRLSFDDQWRTTVILNNSHYLVQAIKSTTAVLSLGQEAPTSRRRLFTLNATCSILVESVGARS